ncbi:unnamed protein product, partial [Mesorhabditis spiculigera]
MELVTDVSQIIQFADCQKVVASFSDEIPEME